MNRRECIKSIGAAAVVTGAGAALPSSALGQGHAPCPADARALVNWRRGFDSQRIPDLGNGFFLNPLVSGDHPDPTILKDGPDYYMTFSTFEAYPGLVIWHSRDLINWRPMTAALKQNIGSVWAPELTKHNGRYFLYIPTKKTSAEGSKTTSWVIWADRIPGPWSDPLDLNLPNHIDPGHAIGEDGSRWLFLSGGDRVRLSEDGLRRIGEPEHVYDPWRYPQDWVIESFSPEGPKITRRGDYYYLVTAVGGTAGPPTGHMVIAARSKSIHGPWEQHPGNPLVRTKSVDEKWWSRGHATLIEGPDGSWWSVYHGYEKDFWTLGRQTLLDPVAWTRDGWFRMTGGDLSQPIRKPMAGRAGPHGQPLSDNFETLALGRKWNFFRPAPDEPSRIRTRDNTLFLAARGKAPSDSSPLLLIAGDQAYRFEADIEIDPGGTAGLILFYDDKLYAGLGFDEARFVTHQYGIERGRPANPHGRKMRMRVTNDRHIVRFDTSGDRGRTWRRFDRGMEVSGYHHNVRGGFMMLRPGLYSAGAGAARFSKFTFQALG